MSAAQTSRRAILSGIAAIPAVACISATAAAADDVDTLFAGYVEHLPKVDDAPSDEALDAEMDVQSDWERRVAQCPPSLMRLAAEALIAIRNSAWPLTSTVAEILEEGEPWDGMRLPMSVLACLPASQLHGTVAHFAADMLAVRSRRPLDTLLFRRASQEA